MQHEFHTIPNRHHELQVRPGRAPRRYSAEIVALCIVYALAAVVLFVTF